MTAARELGDDIERLLSTRAEIHAVLGREEDDVRAAQIEGSRLFEHT
jgi:hypothetical protein